MIERLSMQDSSIQLRTATLEGTQHNQNRTGEVDKTYQTQNREQQVSKENVQEVVDGLNKFIQPTHTSLHFKLHEKLNEYYVQIINQDTNETIREIPSQKVLDMYASMLEYVGILVDKKI